MELLQKLVRANALLLQGAYQGAENLLDSAIVDARTLLEENARLQSVIDEANAQEPAIVVKGRKVVGFNPADGTRIEGEFYASPIPAQQAPAVAVPKPQKCCAFWRNDAIENAALIAERYAQVYCAQDIRNMKRNETSPRITEQYDKLAGLVVQELYNNGGPHESQLDEARRIINFIASRLPQRVTEQDAREIAKSVANVIRLKDSIVDAWFDGEGRDLLNKLNKVEL